jgi:acyl dehydratase
MTEPVTLSFDGLPSPSLLAALLRWRGTLPAGATIPRIHARATGVRVDARAYADACGFAPSDAAPLTYAQVLAAPLHLAVLGHAAFPLPLAGTVHTWQRIVQRRPLREGETLTVEAWVDGHTVLRSGGTFDLCTRLLAGDEVPWEGVTRILSRKIPGHGGPREARAPALPEDAQRPVATIEVPVDTGRRYARVSGDANPIHTSWLAARLFGFPRPIAHGMWALARAVAELGATVPQAACLEAAFRAPVFIPGRVEVLAEERGTRGVSFTVRDERVCVTGSVTPLDEANTDRA